MEVPQARWMVDFMENPRIKRDDKWGIPILGNTYVFGNLTNDIGNSIGTNNGI